MLRKNKIYAYTHITHIFLENVRPFSKSLKEYKKYITVWGIVGFNCKLKQSYEQKDTSLTI